MHATLYMFFGSVASQSGSITVLPMFVPFVPSFIFVLLTGTYIDFFFHHYWPLLRDLNYVANAEKSTA